MTTFGRLRLRRDRDGAIEVWARGWRLELRVLGWAPAVLALMLLVSPTSWAVRAIGGAALLFCAWVTLRLGRLGFRLTPDRIEVIRLVRTISVSWDDVVGFVGERSAHDGRALLVTRDGRRVPAPGRFAIDEMGLHGDDADGSVVGELNRFVWSVRRGEPIPV